MDGKQWEKIRRNLDEISNVYPRDIIPILFQDDVVDLNDKQKLESITANGECMRQLCLILKNKHPEKRTFRSFLDALKKTGLEDNANLSEKIEQTETNSDDSVTAEVDVKQLEAKARRIIDCHFKNEKGAETPLSQFMDILCKNGAFAGCNGCWKNNDLIDFIKDHFVGVEVFKKKHRGKSREKLYVKNVAELSTKTRQSSDQEKDLKGNSPGQSHPESDVPSLTPMELKVFLEGYFNAKKMNIKPLLEMERNEISGDAFLLLTNDDIKEVAPSASFGARHLLQKIIENLKNPLKSIRPCCRKFDQPVPPDFFYPQGKCVSLEIEFLQISKKTSCIKNFHIVENPNETKRYECIAFKVIQFVAACINERQNGTIYFGINNKACQDHKAGEIIGVVASKDKLEEKTAQMFKLAFHTGQLKHIEDVVRPVRFVPVQSEDELSIHEEKTVRWVIEYDVVPMNTILGKQFVKLDVNKISLFNKKSKLGGFFRFSEGGQPKALNFAEEHAFDTQKDEILTQRNQEENTKVEKDIPNQHEHLQNLVTGGSSRLEDDIIPLVILGPRGNKHDCHSLSQIKSFVKCLSPEAVFDFDPDGCSKGIYHDVEKDENMRVQTLDNFDRSKSSSTEALSQLRQEKNRIWIFCNGYEPTNMISLPPHQWNMQRKFAFQEALKFHLNMFNKDRILLIICLFSSNQGPLVEACDDVLLHLPNQWIVLAESENEAEPWQDIILQRNRVGEKKELLNRCIVGMTWQQISNCFKDWCGNEQFQMCRIPHSNGSPVEIPEKMCKKWCDVELLSVTDPISHIEDYDKKCKIAQDVEENFYRGNEVDWLNFWFKDQVQNRSIHQPLKKEVEKALCGKEQDKEGRVNFPVFFYHQPGAGGTTVAKQILWELRTEYRCCVILDITKDTCNQLVEIYIHQDEHPKPLLLLCDTKEDVELEYLKNELETAGNKIKSQLKGNSSLFSVLLICLRCASLPVHKHQSHLKILRQELDDQELYLFKSKYKILEKKYNENKNENTDPRFLISFNLLKHNFDQEHLRNLVTEYLQNITDEKEREMIKIVSLLNTFDADFNQITVYLFDVILQTERYIYQNTYTSHARLSRRTKWEARVSPGFKVLMNISKSNNELQRRRKTIRIFNQPLAAQILECFIKETRQPLSKMMLDLMDSKWFDEDHKALASIHKIIRNIIMRRQYKIEQSCIKKEKFSQLILNIQQNENCKKALSILTKFYSLKKDAFTAQHIARFHIELKDYESAESYARNALKDFPNNSFLLNTYGRVFLRQLSDEVESDNFQIESEEQFETFAQQFRKCSDCFRKSQASSVTGCHKVYSEGHNNQSFIDELQSVLKFIEGLERCLDFESKEQFHRYLAEDEYDKENPKISKPRLMLKTLFQGSQKIIQTLDETLMSCESQEEADEYKICERNMRRLKFLKLKMKLEVYYGENTDEVPSNLNEKEKCEYRYICVKAKGVKFIRYLQDVQNIDELLKKYVESYNLLLPNVNGVFCSFEYLKAMMDIVLVLIIHEKLPCSISYQEILTWSFNLCFKHEPKTPRGNILLENYLYFFLLHFPTQERGSCILSYSHEAFLDALRRWHQVHIKICEKQEYEIGRHYKEPPLFCLGKGPALKDLVYIGKEAKMSKIDDYLLLRSRDLRVMSGTLKEDGKEIQFSITTKDDFKQFIDIPTSHAIEKRSLWQKEVYFFLGFSLTGLKALCVSDNKSVLEKDPAGLEQSTGARWIDLFKDKD